MIGSIDNELLGRLGTYHLVKSYNEEVTGTTLVLFRCANGKHLPLVLPTDDMAEADCMAEGLLGQALEMDGFI